MPVTVRDGQKCPSYGNHISADHLGSLFQVLFFIKATLVNSSQMTTRSVSKNRRFAWMRAVFELQSISTVGVVLIVISGGLGIVQVIANGALASVILAIVAYECVKRLDQGVPLTQLTSLLAVLQWLIGPVLNYGSDYQFGRYSMYVPEEQYFAFALPATAFYVAIMLSVGASVKQRQLLQFVDRRNFFTIGIVLNIVAFAAALASSRVGGSLGFLCHLVSQTRYVGALYFLFSKHPQRLPAAALSCVQLFTSSLAIGMFHDLILWMTLIFCYWFAQRKWILSTKLLTILAAVVVLFLIQSVKQDYRKLLARGEKPSLVSMMVTYATPDGRAWEDSVLSLTITRLNQGWIISAIMKNVPENEPFAEGETVKEAILSSVAPRVLWADKKSAGGRENFRRFTGLQIGDQTAMSISPLGEAYANFGVEGGVIFMGVFGAVFGLSYFAALKYTLRHPTFIFWIPLIFYQAIKAETELVVVMNQLTKGAVVAVTFHYGICRLFPTRIRMPVLPPGHPPPVSVPDVQHLTGRSRKVGADAS